MRLCEYYFVVTSERVKLFMRTIHLKKGFGKVSAVMINQSINQNLFSEQ